MGEYVLKDMVKKAGVADRFEIASAAVSREEIGEPVYPPARRELQKHGIDCRGHAARQVTMEDYKYYDRIYYMDSSNLRWLKRLLPADPEKIRSFLPRDVADPCLRKRRACGARVCLQGQKAHCKHNPLSSAIYK